jgi:hypothetical protein
MPDQAPERLTDAELSELERLEREAVSAHLRFDELGTNAANLDYEDAETRLRRALRDSAHALLSAARREREQAQLPNVSEPEQLPDSMITTALCWTHPSSRGLYVTVRLRDGAMRVSDSPRDMAEAKWLASVFIAAARELESRLSGSAR